MTNQIIILAYLQEEKTWATQTGEQVTSKKMGDAKYIYPNKYPWVEATHINSEVESYISRYAGTVCCENSSSQLGMLVVLSAHQDMWSKYADAFLRAVNSLKVLDIEDAISKVRVAESKNATSGMGGYIEGLLQEDGVEGTEDSGSLLDDPLSLMALGLGLLALIAFYILKKKKSKKKRKRLKRRKKK